MEADEIVETWDTYWAERYGAPGSVERHRLLRAAENKVVEAAMDWALGVNTPDRLAVLQDACLVLRAVRDLS